MARAHLGDAANGVNSPDNLTLVRVRFVESRWVCGCGDKLVSHHLGRLRREGLVSSRREGKVVFAALTERGQRALAMAGALAA